MKYNKPTLEEFNRSATYVIGKDLTNCIDDMYKIYIIKYKGASQISMLDMENIYREANNQELL